MKPLYAILLLAGMGMSGCDDPHDNAPIQSTSFVIPSRKFWCRLPKWRQVWMGGSSLQTSGFH